MDGTPLVARMPYDNKQCKSYKGLKIKYASLIKDGETDPNLDNELPLINWENDVNFDGTKHNPLINLTSENNGVGSFINPEGYTKVYDSLMDYAKHGKVTLVDKVGNYISDLTSAGISQLTYNDLLFNLNPEFANYYDTVTDSSTDDRYYTCLSGINLCDRLTVWAEVDGHDTKLSGGYISKTDNDNLYKQLKDVISSSGKLSAFVEDLKFTLENGNIETLDTILTNYQNTLSKINSAATVNDLPSNYDLPGLGYSETQRESARALQAKYNNKPFITFITDLIPKFKVIQEKILLQNLSGLGEPTKYTTELEQLKKLKYYVTANSKSHDKTVSGVINVLTGFTELNKWVPVTSSDSQVNGITSPLVPLSATLSVYPASGNISGELTETKTIYFHGKEIYSIASGSAISSWLNAYNELILAQQEYNVKSAAERCLQTYSN